MEHEHNSDLEFRVLGQIEVVRDGMDKLEMGPKQVALLALLLIHTGKVVSTDHLLEALWPGVDGDKARRTLWAHVSKLRKALAPGTDPDSSAQPLSTAEHGYMMRVAGGKLDALVFEDLVSEASRSASKPIQSAELLETALGLWRGRPYEDVFYEEFAQGEIRRLEELRLGAIEDRIGADLALGRQREVIGEIESLVESHPLRERLWELLMLAQYRSNRQTDALRSYQRLRRRLEEELGLSPSPKLQRLEEQILTHDPRLEISEGRSEADNLPERASSLVGRRTDVSELAATVRSHRLVTLVGVGGVGKTSLALEVARALQGDFADGAWMIDLTSVTDPALVPQTIAATLGVGEAPEGGLDGAVDILKPLGVLLILDNCEHLLTQCARLAQKVLSHARHVSLVATSREHFSIEGEIVWEVQPLGVPDRAATVEDAQESDSVRLLVERATARDRHFRLGEDNVAAVVDICDRLEGVPLTIELAAAQVGFLGAEAVAKRLAHHVTTLESDRRDADDRHRSVVASIGWSYGLLTDSEQLLFDRLSVFSSTFTLEAAKAVCAGGPIDAESVVGLLRHLVDASMVVPVHGVSGERRFKLFETLREYGKTRLEERDDFSALQKRHAVFFRSQVGSTIRGMPADEKRKWLDRVNLDYENYRTAMAWSLCNEPRDLSLRILSGLRLFWVLRGAYVLDSLVWARRMLDGADGADPTLRSRALIILADELRRQGKLDGALAASTEAVEVMESSSEGGEDLVDALLARGEVAHRRKGDEGEGYMERALHLSRELAYREGEAVALLDLGFRHLSRGSTDAKEMLQAALRMFQELGHDRPVAGALGGLGRVALQNGNAPEALTLVEEGVAMCHEGGAQHELPYRFNELGTIYLTMDQTDQAAAAVAKAMELNQRDPSQMSSSLVVVSALAAARDDCLAAATLLSAARSIRQRLGLVDFSAFTRIVSDQAETKIVNRLSAAERNAATDQGRSHTEHDAAALARHVLAAADR